MQQKNFRSLVLPLKAGFILLFSLGVLFFDNSLTTSSCYATLHDKTGKRGRKKVYLTVQSKDRRKNFRFDSF